MSKSRGQINIVVISSHAQQKNYNTCNIHIQLGTIIKTQQSFMFGTNLHHIHRLLPLSPLTNPSLSAFNGCCPPLPIKTTSPVAHSGRQHLYFPSFPFSFKVIFETIAQSGEVSRRRAVIWQKSTIQK